MRAPSRSSRRAAVALAAVLVVAPPVAAMATSGPSTPPSDTTLPIPPVTVTTDSWRAGDGDIFISPFGAPTTYANGAEILSPDGKHVVWFHAVPAGQAAADFRTQTYRGRPVLTFWQGTGLGGLAQGTDYIYDDHYRQIADGQRGQRLLRRRPRVPDHPAEHRADPGLRDGDRGPAPRSAAPPTRR